MITDREHIPLDVLNDYVDDSLPTADRDRVAEHIDRCSRCRSEHDQIVSMLRSMDSLPDSVLPPEDLWTEIRTSIDRRKEVVLHANTVSGSHARQPAPRRPWWAYRSMVAAAAVVLVVGTSALTTLILRSSDGSMIARSERGQAAPSATDAPLMLPAGFREAEAEYLQSIGELRSVLQAHRSVLKPETIATVEHSLSVIDIAIDEARKALLSDPGNETLVDLLKASYERKLDLLRRAADLGART